MQEKLEKILIFRKTRPGAPKRDMLLFTTFQTICMRGFSAALAHTTHTCQISNIFALLHIPSHISARNCTENSLSEALILASTNPQYDKNCSLIYRFNTWKQQTQNMGRTCCAHKLFFVFVLTFRTIHVHNMFWAWSFHVLNL